MYGARECLVCAERAQRPLALKLLMSADKLLGGLGPKTAAMHVILCWLGAAGTDAIGCQGGGSGRRTRAQIARGSSGEREGIASGQ